MNFDDLTGLADAVLYEGYALYPYRQSSLKNRVRFTTGGVYPPAYSRSQTGADACSVQIECLLKPGPGCRLAVRLRYLELGQATATGWQETQERALDFAVDLPLETVRHGFELGRQRGTLEFSVQPLSDGFSRLRVVLENTSQSPLLEREAALAHTLLGAHLLLGLENGAFVSLLEPPAALAQAAEGCTQRGLYPVLAGRRGSQDRVLASPIILYDYPETAGQSPGDLFDATEIDEILSLRILTMTDAEKDEARRSDARVRALLERTEALAPDAFARLHGVMRGALRAAFQPGDRVVLRPSRRADVFDLALTGRVATVRSIEQDFEDRVYLSVTIDGDPGEDLGIAGLPGHRFFFHPDEVEPVERAP
jgi:hypothetical protein